MSLFSFGEFSVRVAKAGKAGDEAYEKAAIERCNAAIAASEKFKDDRAAAASIRSKAAMAANPLDPIRASAEAYFSRDYDGTPPPKPEYVYALLIDGAIKIGFSTDIEQRLKSYRQPSRHVSSVTMLACVEGSKPDETRILRALASQALHTSREYFKPTPVVLEVVAQMRRLDQTPSESTLASLTAGMGGHPNLTKRGPTSKVALEAKRKLRERSKEAAGKFTVVVNDKQSDGRVKGGKS